MSDVTKSPDSWNQLAEDLREGLSSSVPDFARVVGGWLHGFMAKWLPEGEDYEQAAIDVLLELVGSLDRFNPTKASLKTWARCVASRRVADYYRGREKATSDEAGKREVAWREKHHIKARLPVESRLFMIEAISALDPEDQELLRLFFDERLSDSEVAEYLGITAGNARQRKRRLVEKLQNSLPQT